MFLLYKSILRTLNEALPVDIERTSDMDNVRTLAGNSGLPSQDRSNEISANEKIGS
jgi:hypothetical protein